MASPKEWLSQDGAVEVETPYTLRARELVDLFNGLCNNLLYILSSIIIFIIIYFFYIN